MDGIRLSLDNNYTRMRDRGWLSGLMIHLGTTVGIFGGREVQQRMRSSGKRTSTVQKREHSSVRGLLLEHLKMVGGLR